MGQSLRNNLPVCVATLASLEHRRSGTRLTRDVHPRNISAVRPYSGYLPTYSTTQHLARPELRPASVAVSENCRGYQRTWRFCHSSHGGRFAATIGDERLLHNDHACRPMSVPEVLQSTVPLFHLALRLRFRLEPSYEKPAVCVGNEYHPWSWLVTCRESDGPRPRPCVRWRRSPEWRNWQTRGTQNPVALWVVWVRPPPLAVESPRVRGLRTCDQRECAVTLRVRYSSSVVRFALARLSPRRPRRLIARPSPAPEERRNVEVVYAAPALLLETCQHGLVR